MVSEPRSLGHSIYRAEHEKPAPPLLRYVAPGDRLNQQKLDTIGEKR
jgi:hypothetical protein